MSDIVIIVHGYEQDKIVISLQPLVTTQYPYTRGGLLLINFVIFHFIMNAILLLFSSLQANWTNWTDVLASSCPLALSHKTLLNGQNFRDMRWVFPQLPSSLSLSERLDRRRKSSLTFTISSHSDWQLLTHLSLYLCCYKCLCHKFLCCLFWRDVIKTLMPTKCFQERKLHRRSFIP